MSAPLLCTLLANNALLGVYYLSLFVLPLLPGLVLLITAGTGPNAFRKLGAAATISGLYVVYLAFNHRVYPPGDQTYGLMGQDWLLHAGLVAWALLAMVGRERRSR